MENIEQAENYLQSIEIQKRKYGEEYVERAITCSNLGNIYGGMGKFDLAEKYLLHGIELQKKEYGEEYVGLAVIYSNLRNIYQ